MLPFFQNSQKYVHVVVEDKAGLCQEVKRKHVGPYISNEGLHMEYMEQ